MKRFVMKPVLFILISAALLAALPMTAAADADTAGSAAEETAEAAAEENGAPVSLTDMAGRSIHLDQPADRIIALTASDCEILYAIGAGDSLVGRGEYCDYPEEVFEVPSVQSGADTSLEQILALDPQVLVMATMAQTEEQVQALEDAGVTVVVSDAQDIEGVYTAIGMLGALTGRTEEAEALADGMKKTFEEVGAAAEEEAGSSVYFEVSPLEYGLWTAGKGTFMDEIATMMGLTNIFADVDGWAEVSEEQVIARAPDYIVTISMYFGEGPTPVEEILSRAGWEEIPAVANRRILNLQNNELSRPAPRLADGAKMLYDFVQENPAEETADQAA